MHILMTANVAWNIWNFRKPIVHELLDRGHRVTVLAPPDETVADLEDLGCRFRPLEMNAKGLSPFEGFKLVGHFKRVFREEVPDVVLSYTIKNNLFGAMAAKAVGIPFLPNVTGLGTAFLSGGTLEKLAKLLYRNAFRQLPVVFFQNEDDRDLFVSSGMASRDQAKLLPGSGIDLDHFHAADYPHANIPTVFLMIARLLRDKGVYEFVDAARQVKRHRPEVRFQLLGATGSENRTAIGTGIVQAWVDAGIVEYLGTAPDVRPAISAGSCVVLPSYREGAPRTLIEAAAMARPLIATDVPGCRAVVDRDVTGYICRAQDASSLADAITRFLDLPYEKQAEMGRAGRAKMEREYDQKIVVGAYLEAIQR